MHRQAPAGPRSGSNWLRQSPERLGRRAERGNARPLPACVGVGARQELHDGEEMAEVLAVVPATTAEDWPLILWYFELGFGEHGRDRRTILFLEAARVRRDAALDQRLQH